MVSTRLLLPAGGRTLPAHAGGGERALCLCVCACVAGCAYLCVQACRQQERVGPHRGAVGASCCWHSDTRTASAESTNSRVARVRLAACSDFVRRGRCWRSPARRTAPAGIGVGARLEPDNAERSTCLRNHPRSDTRTARVGRNSRGKIVRADSGRLCRARCAGSEEGVASQSTGTGTTLSCTGTVGARVCPTAEPAIFARENGTKNQKFARRDRLRGSRPYL